jgi:hypothetical protein
MEVCGGAQHWARKLHKRLVGRHGHTLRRVLPYLVEDAENGLSFDFRGLLEDLRQDLAGQVG